MREKRKHQFSKSTSSKKTTRKRDISFGLPYSEFPAATGTFTGLAISVLLGLFGAVNTYASSINITLTGNANLNLVKSNSEPVFGTTASTPQTATITSDHFTGYTLTIAGQDDIGSLKGANDNTKTIPSIQTAISESTFKNDTQYNDTWGFLPNKLHVSGSTITNENYQPAPKRAGTTIDVTTSPTSNEGNKYNLALGAKVTPAMSLDSYGQTFVLAATGNGYDYHIGYTDDLADIPDDQYDTGASSNTVQLSSTVPVKAGYVFRGWCSVKTTNGGAICPGTTYQPGATITLDGSNGNNYDFHAIWEPVTFAKAFADASASMTMQNMTSSICSAVAIGQVGTLTDTRDSKTYNVGKMKDGRCWMLDNLALGGNNTIALTPSDTNITNNFTLPASTTSIGSLTVAAINASKINSIPTDTESAVGGWKAGVYYNYCAVSGGSYCFDENGTLNSFPKYDICPKNWRLPSAGIGGEIQNMIDVYGNNYSSIRSALRIPLSGRYSNKDGLTGFSSEFLYWTSSLFNNTIMITFTGTSRDQVVANSGHARDYGLTMRCIAK